MKYKTIIKYRIIVVLLFFGFLNIAKSFWEPELFLLIWQYLRDNPVKVGSDLVWIGAALWGAAKNYRWWYHEIKSENLVYMRISVPREDSKMDYERKNEKDFKEKIGIMAQLYRALSEISEMNSSNTIHSLIWQYDKVSFEFFVQDKELSFYVVCDKYFQGIVEKQITSFYQNADVQISEEGYELHPMGTVINGFSLALQKDFWFPIRTYKIMESDPLNDIANAFSKMSEDERATIQFVINPRSDSWQKKARKVGTALFKNKKEHFSIPGLGWLGAIFGAVTTGKVETAQNQSDGMVRMLQPLEESYKRVGEKSGQVGFDVAIRVLASASTKERTEDLLNDIIVGFSIFRDDFNNSFHNSRLIPINFINAALVYHGFKKRLCNFYLNATSILTPDELATVFHFPDSKYNKVPIIKWLPYKVLAAPVDLPTTGVLLGYNVYRGVKREVRMLPDDRTRHFYCIGKSGSGKSVFLSWLARQDIINGDGVCVIDPHGDLIEELLLFVPKHRVKDVVVFSPADTDRPLGLNLLEGDTPEEMDMASSQAMEIFIKLFGEEVFGARIQHYFRNGCLTLMADKEDGATLLDVPRLFTDDQFRQYKVSKVKNPIVLDFWEREYASTGDREKQEMIPYFSSKFGPFISNTIVRNLIGQTKSSFNLREAMDTQKIVLVNLSKGLIGDLNTQLLGLILVAKVQMAAMSRVDTEQSLRKKFYLYVDEFQNFATDSFCSILSEARKYQLALIMAHQYIAQLSTGAKGGKGGENAIRDAVFGNVGSMMSFKVGAADAEYLEKEYQPDLTQQDILGIANYKAYLKLNIKNTTSRPFSLETIYDMKAANTQIAEIARNYSRMKYGRKKLFVDQEICARIGIEAKSDEKYEKNGESENLENPEGEKATDEDANASEENNSTTEEENSNDNSELEEETVSEKDDSRDEAVQEKVAEEKAEEIEAESEAEEKTEIKEVKSEDDAEEKIETEIEENIESEEVVKEEVAESEVAEVKVAETIVVEKKPEIKVEEKVIDKIKLEVVEAVVAEKEPVPL